LPLLAKRALYVQLMSLGTLSSTAACEQVGVSRKTGQRWRLGQMRVNAAGIETWVEPVVQPRRAAGSPRYLSEEERTVVADGLRAGRSRRSIASELGRSVSTVCREISRNAETSGEYRPHAAHRRMLDRRPRPRQRRVVLSCDLRRAVQERLDKRWSPEQVSHSLRADMPDRPDLHLAPESIYQAIYAKASVLTTSPAVVLRSRRAYRRPRRHGERVARFAAPAKSISTRPAEVADRVQPGNWEGDLIIGKANKTAIGTLVERSSRLVILVRLVGTHHAVQLRDELIKIFGALPQGMGRSLTWDQGGEMARHHEFEAASQVPVYICDPHSPWQRGSNENTNGLLRQYFPKGTDLSLHSPEDLDRVADELNARPRKTLGWNTPRQVFDSLATKTV
jgi:transposase, IS30 family